MANDGITIKACPRCGATEGIWWCTPLPSDDGHRYGSRCPHCNHTWERPDPGTPTKPTIDPRTAALQDQLFAARQAVIKEGLAADSLRAENVGLRKLIGEMRERLVHVFESPCPNDTNGDEDCGKPLCMYCGKLIEQAIASADAALNLNPCGHPKTAVIGRTSQFCGECERAAKAKQV